ncbi:MAG: restriction endonuclease [Coriobacteriia bacterium]|nr:restriction endonuclease [Coriobacteriia bacterium]MCL2746409.1 restriction endonuclease [Coriobacteriia bacterium]
MFETKDIVVFLGQTDYDLRISNYGRWIDQKCTPDVVSFIAECVLSIDSESISEGFSARDIWHSEFAGENTSSVFSKPDAGHIFTRNEYDKFFAQPLNMLAYSGVLKLEKSGNKNIYFVKDRAVLEYISLRERNALAFISEYCTKVLKDSGIWTPFDSFFEKQDEGSFYIMKESFENFVTTNTAINGVVEVRRIFTKVLNPIANALGARGTVKGRLSRNPITYAELMYNRENFRDLSSSKPKDVTRLEWLESRKEKSRTNYSAYQSQKAKRFLRRFNDVIRQGSSEVQDEYSHGLATQVHHIFPEHEYPEISGVLENLIVLTPTQHMNMAHPRNNTHRIDLCYQKKLLHAKLNSIEENLSSENEEPIYSFKEFAQVLNVGVGAEFDWNNITSEAISDAIDSHFFNFDSSSLVTMN